LAKVRTIFWGEGKEISLQTLELSAGETPNGPELGNSQRRRLKGAGTTSFGSDLGVSLAYSKETPRKIQSHMTQHPIGTIV